MSNPLVRIGIAVRRRSVIVRTPQSVPPKGTGGEPLAPGRYRVRVAERGRQAPWAGRVAVFTDDADAGRLAGFLTEHGLPAQVVPMGRSVDWGAAGKFDAGVHAVLSGEYATREEAVNGTREALVRMLEAGQAGALPGMPAYPDQVPAVEAVRLAPVEGGQLELAPLEASTDTRPVRVPSPLRLAIPRDGDAYEVEGVRIGIDFHWDHEETLDFRGSLELVADGDGVTVVNELELDDYLTAVLGSEMRPDWPRAALGAQAVAARSTVLATRGRHHFGEVFDLCHDDHCQDYQGISRESSTARDALKDVEGLLLVHGDRVADARFAKTCGGISDHYHVAWDDEVIPYLVPVVCGPHGDDGGEGGALLAADGEETVRYLLERTPEWASCNPQAARYPESVREMEELYRWRRTLTSDQLAELVRLRTGRDLGVIRELTPLERGASGRIRYLRVVGEKGAITVGKELPIRRLLSNSHLPSSAFTVEHGDDGSVTLEGIGWGHGVGLCQLGAAALARRGWAISDLLMHYYPTSNIAKSKTAKP